MPPRNGSAAATPTRRPKARKGFEVPRQSEARAMVCLRDGEEEERRKCGRTK